MKIAYAIMDRYEELLAEHVEPIDEIPLLKREFSALGAELSALRWRDGSVDWARFDAVIPKACWDYFEAPRAFFAWLDRLRERGARVVNELDLIRWNADKTYLLDLRDAGVRVAPLLHFRQGSQVDLAAVLASSGWEEFVLKPAISGGARRTLRASAASAPDVRALLEAILAESGLIVQPFFPEIPRDGELSFVFFGGQFSHAVLKVPRTGDYRSQPTFGATVTAVTPPSELLSQARAVLSALPGRPVYARVDGFVREGALLVMEVELIEPFLFLDHSDGGAPRFCAAVVEQIAG